MSNNVLYVGLDVHKNSIDVAIAEAGSEIRHYGSIGGELKDLEKVIRKLHSQGSELYFAYEAGPCGYQIFRFLKEKNYSCLVAAPSLIPRACFAGQQAAEKAVKALHLSLGQEAWGHVIARLLQ